MTNLSLSRSATLARSFSADYAFGLPIWAAFLLALEPGNIARAIEAGASPAFDREAIRIAAATLLGALSAPLVLELIRRFPVEPRRFWPHLTIQAVATAAIAMGLIVVSCILATTFHIGDSRPVLVALPDQINANWALLIFCLATMSAIAHAVRFSKRQDAAPTTLTPPAPAFISAVTVKSRGRQTVVDLSAVDWIETQGNYLALHAGGSVQLHRESSQSFEEKLDPARFIRIHRRALVAIDRIREMATLGNGDAEVGLADGTRLRVSRTFRDKLKQSLKQT